MSSELKKFKNKKAQAQSPAYRMRISCIVTDSENNESASMHYFLEMADT